MKLDILFQNKILLVAIVIITLVVVSGLWVLLFRPQQSPGTTQPNQQIGGSAKDVKLLTIIPDPSVLLEPDQTQTWSLVFDRSVDLTSLEIKLVQRQFPSKALIGEVQTTQFQTDNEQGLVVTIQGSIEPSSEYDLIISDKASGQALVDYIYTSSGPIFTPAPSNNLNLRDYLPHETDSYRLSYDQATNSYVFSFKYNDNSTQSLDSQYSAARANATQFIRSQGINPSTITIQWNYK